MIKVKKSALHKLLVTFTKACIDKAESNTEEYNWDCLVTPVNDRKICLNCYVRRGEAGYIANITLDGVSGHQMRISRAFIYDQLEILDTLVDHFIDDVEQWVNLQLGITE